MSMKIEKGLEILKKLREAKAIATDIDGTITADRKSYYIPPEVIEGMFLLRKANVKLFFVSANAFPIVYGLARYLGADGVVAENGCIVTSIEKEMRKPSIVELCSESRREIAKLIAEKMPERFRESWQNDFRKYDFALEVLDKNLTTIEIITSIKKLLKENSLDEKVDVNYSGYAVHITPKGAGKLNGLKHLLSTMDIKIEEVVGIGDSYMDWDFIKETGVKVAVANADNELKEKVEIITDFDSGYGFAQLCRIIAEAKILEKKE